MAGRPVNERIEIAIQELTAVKDFFVRGDTAKAYELMARPLKRLAAVAAMLAPVKSAAQTRAIEEEVSADVDTPDTRDPNVPADPKKGEASVTSEHKGPKPGTDKIGHDKPGPDKTKTHKVEAAHGKKSYY